MTDSCYCWGYVRQSDWDRFRAITDVNLDVAGFPTTNATHYTSENVDYAMTDEVIRAAQAELVFVAYNGRGDEYPGGVVVSTGDGRVHRAECGDGNYIVTPVDEWGDPSPNRHRLVREACLAIRKVKLLCRMEVLQNPTIPAG